MLIDHTTRLLAKKLGWRYTRYADDLTFSLPAEAQGKPLHEGESMATLAGYAAYIAMTDPVLGQRLLQACQQQK